MKSLLHHFPDAIEQNVVRDLVEDHQDCLVTFLMPRPHHTGKESAVGTGFFVTSLEPSVVTLVTAKHVFDDFDREKGRITVGTLGMTLGSVGKLYFSEDVDLAPRVRIVVAPINP